VGEGDGGDPGGVLRLGVAQPAQLRDGQRRDRHGADRLRPGGGAGLRVAVPELADEVHGRLGGAGVVPEQRLADDGAVRVEHDHAVLLPAHRDGGDVVQAAGVRDGGLQRLPPAVGVDLGAVRVGRAAGAHQGTGLGVAHDDLAGLGGRVHPGDQRHR
jgi:hypothetical protein